MNNEKPLVAIHCLVYNHEPYLRDCFEGFVMQQTNFPFVAIVHDDASTDASAAIIREYEKKYPHIFKPIYETENQYSKRDGSLERIMNEAIIATGARYVAICEGDDYWIAPLKLQTQVNFLENNTDFSMCFHSATIEDKSHIRPDIKCENIQDKEYFTNDIFPGWIVPTASVMYRSCVIKNSLPLKKIEWMKYGDITLFLQCSHTGRLWGMNERMSVYRVLPTGAVGSERTDLEATKKLAMHYKFLHKNFDGINVKWISDYLARFYYSSFRNAPKCYYRIFCLLIALYHSPKFVIGKFLRVFRNKY